MICIIRFIFFKKKKSFSKLKFANYSLNIDQKLTFIIIILCHELVADLYRDFFDFETCENQKPEIFQNRKLPKQTALVQDVPV